MKTRPGSSYALSGSALTLLSLAALLVTSPAFVPSPALARFDKVGSKGRTCEDPLHQNPGHRVGAHWRSAAVMAARRDTLRMPSSEPMVPYKREGAQFASWVPVSQRLQQERIIMVGKFIDEEYANRLIAILLYHEKEDATKRISMYFNCPGALIRPALAVYDTMMHMRPEISTLNLGLATGMVSFLCAAGKKGKRYALPNARFLMQRTGMEDPYRGQASDIGVEVRNVMKGNDRMEEALQRITGHTVAKIHEDFQRDFYLSSSEAVQYGIIDQVLLPREKTRQELYQYSDIVGGPRTRTEDPDFGTFGEGQQKYGDQSGGGWGGGAGRGDKNDPVPA